MKRIKLTHGLYAKCDDADFTMLSRYQWQARWNERSKVWRACTMILDDEKWKLRDMARILIPTTGDERVDHKNHNTLDVRRRNLRKCTRLQNLWNRRVRSDNQHGLKGVSYNKRFKVYTARICVNKQRIHLGTYKTPKQAALAYRKAAKHHFGEFACFKKRRDLCPA